jgi:hypothetical protein
MAETLPQFQSRTDFVGFSHVWNAGPTDLATDMDLQPCLCCSVYVYVPLDLGRTMPIFAEHRANHTGTRADAPLYWVLVISALQSPSNSQSDYLSGAKY